MTSYTINDQVNATNTALAAGTTELVISGTNRAKFFNSLTVVNRSGVAIRIFYDGQDNRYDDVEKGVMMVVEPEEGKVFNSLTQKNLDAALAETVSTIQFSAYNKKRID